MSRLRICMALAVLLASGGVHAHSIGGEGVATVARLDVDVDGMLGQYEIQYGETASLRLRQAIDANGDGRLDFDEQKAHLDTLARRYAAGLRLTLDGEAVPLSLRAGELLPRGQWSVVPVRSAVVFDLRVAEAGLAGERTQLAFADSNQLPGVLHRTWVVTSYELVDLESPAAGSAAADTATVPGGGSAVKGIQFQGQAAGVRGQVDLRLSAEARAGLHGESGASEPTPSPWAAPVSAGPFTAAVFGAIVGFGLATALHDRRRRRHPEAD